MSEQEKLSIEETTDVFEFMTDTVQALADARKDDGQISLTEWIKTAMKEAPEAIKALRGMDKIPAEMKDLDSDEAEQMANMGLQLMAAVASLVGLDSKES